MRPRAERMMPKSGPTGHLQPREIKRRGVHYTPPQLARFLAERAIAQLPAIGSVTVLDPACGDGSLLRAVWEVSPHELREKLILRGYDTDDRAADAARAA